MSHTAINVFTLAINNSLAYPANILSLRREKRLEKRTIITKKQQEKLFDAALIAQIDNFFKHYSSSNCLEQHFERLYKNLGLVKDISHKSFECRMDINKTVIKLFSDLETFEGRLKFCEKYLIKFDLNFSDIKIPESVLQAIFSEYIKNAVKFTVSGSEVKIASNNLGVFMENKHFRLNVRYHFMETDREKLGHSLLKDYAKRLKGKYHHSDVWDGKATYKTEFML